MNMGKPLLSVVVPTKDRYKYLKHLIKLIQSYNSDEWEIVVQDNTEDNAEILDFLKELNYPGCKYFHEKGQLPMTTNADKAILHSEGEYVCFLGDDDGVCPNALDYCRLMKAKGYEALRSNLAQYFWPDAISQNESKCGKLKPPHITKNKIIQKTDEVLMDVVNRGFVDRGNLPSVYHGIVSRKALNSIYDKCSTFFPGQSPDISNGIAMALVLDRFLYVDDVVTISGASKFHGGATIGNFKRYPQISDMVWFRPGAETIWDKRLPKIAVGSIIWAESSIETLNNMGRQDIVDKIDFETIYKFFVVYHYPVRKLAYSLSKHPLSLRLYSSLMIIIRVWNALLRVVKEKFRLNSETYTFKSDLNDMESVVSYIDL
jgi:glycosyltransferase involved in cell wall biosynthesis